MFNTINRDVLILFPKQPLFDWVNFIFPDDKMVCKKPMAHDEGDIFLIPEFDHPDYAIEFLKDNFVDFFEHELFEWTTDENFWPDKLSWEMFENWFHYSIQSVVMDTLDDEIIKEDY
ncbi:MAG: hypothetical protein JXP36_00105 [Bacteroidales bacterium]|nr:hypothetical protein [Bacteroidales bacterium]